MPRLAEPYPLMRRRVSATEAFDRIFPVALLTTAFFTAGSETSLRTTRPAFFVFDIFAPFDALACFRCTDLP
jgi:hypothetical protein